MITEPPPAPQDPPGAQPQKKGLPTIAWVGIGCGGLALVAIILLVMALGWVGKKGKEFVDTIQDPAKLAEFVVDKHPEWDVQSNDPESGTMTIRNPTTGQEMTLNYSDIAEGKFLVDTPDGAYQIDASGGAQGIEVQTPDGRTVVGGAGAASQIPSWVPRYPGEHTTHAAYSTASPEAESGTFTVQTKDTPDAVAEAYEAMLDNLGYSHERQRVTTAVGAGKDLTQITIRGTLESPARTASVTVTSDGSGGSAAIVTYEGQPEP